MDADVLVIGAGAAGLAAAARVRAAGRRPLVLEARDRLGGRIHTDRDFAGFPVERGAEMVTGARSRIREVVQAAGLRCSPALSPWAGRVLDRGRLRRAVPWMARSAWGFVRIVRDVQRERADDESLAAVLDRCRSPVRVRRLADALSNSACASVEHLSVRELARFLKHTEEGGGDSRLIDGYDCLIAHLADGLEIVHATPAAAVEWTESEVRIDAGRPYIAPVVIVTVPCGVLKAARPRFSPPLPRRMEDAIERLNMYGGMKVSMRFRAPFWPRGMSFAIVDEAVPIVWPPRNGEPVLTAFVMGLRADALRAAPGPVERVLAALENAWGGEPRRSLCDALVTDWGADPWTLGGYSSVPSGAHGLRSVLAAPYGPLIVAGEATDDIAPGTVSGAIRSGERAAAQALARLS